MLGALAGVFGAIIYLIIGLPINFLILGAGALEQQLTQTGLEVPLSGAVLIVVSSLVGAVCLVILAVLGGLIAVPIFEKRKGQPAPPPPPQNLGGQGGYGSGM